MFRPDPLSTLQSARLLGSIPDGELDRIADHLLFEEVGPGQVVVREGERGDRCYFIVEGQVDVSSRDLIGEEVILGTLGPGDVFGEIALVREVPRTATVRAVTGLHVFTLDRAAFETLVPSCPVFVDRLKRHAMLLEVHGYLRRASPFAHLPRDTMEQLVAQLVPVSVRAGSDVVRQGEAGDLFYLIQEGRFEVVKDGKPIQVLERGDCFGEVALMATEHRTATVRALEDGQLLALAQPDFQRVVGSLPTARGLLSELVRIRHAVARVRGRPPESDAQPTPVLLPPARRSFWVFLLFGVAFFAALSLMAVALESTALSVAALTVGAFVGPVSYVAYLAGSNILRHRPRVLATTFVVSAIVGVPAAVFVLRWIAPMDHGLGTGLLVGLVEEPLKLVGVLWLLSRSSSRFQIDGVIYGAAAGMGFAVLENLLYGLGRLELLQNLITTLWLRTLLSPFSHGTWTAIICAAIWREKGSGAPRFGPRVFAAFATSVGLHALWDWQVIGGMAYLVWVVGVGALGLWILRTILVSAAQEEVRAIVRLNPELGKGSTGSRVRATCSNCGQEAPSGARYCARCGRALRQGDTAATGRGR